ncbi:MAG: hypothetical protein EAZ68_23680, partial [Oscillatoriales cyanobacterium]
KMIVGSEKIMLRKILLFKRDISLNLLNQHKTSKSKAKNKRLRAWWDDDYFTKILAVAVN